MSSCSTRWWCVTCWCQVQLIVNETMGRQPCCDKQRVKRGLWTAEEDKKLINFIQTHGHCCWRAVPKLAGLLRCGKSCRMRWTNYLRPDLKRGLLTAAEEQIVIDLHAKLGNRWSKIAAMLPGRTDNEIKNHWNTHIKKKLIKMGMDPATHQPLDDTKVANSQSVTTIEPAKSSDIGDMLSLKEHRQEMMPIHGEVGTSQSTAIIEPAKSSDTGDMQSLQERSQEKSSWKEQNSDACRHDLDPIMNWPLDVDHDLDPIMYSPLDVDLPSDGPWLNYTCSNCDVLGTVADPLPSDEAFDWLVDYQNLGISSLDLVGDSTVHSSNGSGF